MENKFNLSIEELETMEAPESGWWYAGVGAGVVVGGGLIYAGIITT